MNRRECFRKAMNHETPEKTLVDLGKHIGSFHKFEYLKLKEYFKDEIELKNENNIMDRMAQTVFIDEELLERFHIDFRWIHPDINAGQVQITDDMYSDMWGVKLKNTGDYWAVCEGPLQKVDSSDLSVLDDLKLPYDLIAEIFKGAGERAKYLYENTDYVIGADGIKAGLLQTALQMRGFENLFMDTIASPKFVEKLFDKLLDVFKEMYTYYLKEVGPYIQILYITDDLGTQTSSLISPKMFRKLLKARNKELIDHIRQYTDAKIMLHSDGAIAPFIDDLVEIGIDIINPVQTSVKGLEDSKEVNRLFGDKISFHGAIDVQQVLPNSSPEEIKLEVERRIRELGENGGYICAACHNISYDIPVENLVALYDAAYEYSMNSEKACN